MKVLSEDWESEEEKQHQLSPSGEEDPRRDSGPECLRHQAEAPGSEHVHGGGQHSGVCQHLRQGGEDASCQSLGHMSD